MGLPGAARGSWNSRRERRTGVGHEGSDRRADRGGHRRHPCAPRLHRRRVGRPREPQERRQAAGRAGQGAGLRRARSVAHPEAGRGRWRGRRSARRAAADPPAGGSPVTPRKRLADDKLPIRMLHDRVLVALETEGERKSSAGILIPATAQMGRRLAWAKVVAIGANVRTVEVDDRVLFDPEDRAEVEVRGDDYILLRERDLHAVAAGRLEDGQTGLYL